MVLKGLKPPDRDALILSIHKKINEIDHPDLSDKNKMELIKLLIKNIDIFDLSLKKAGKAIYAPHEINTGDAKPVKIPARRRVRLESEAIEKEITTMLETGVIKKSISP